MDALREQFRLVHGLTHPNIAKALVLHPVRKVNIWDETARREMRLSPGDSVMVMDYAPGVTLSRWRRQFPDGIVPPDLALEIGRQLASALDYAHGERIVHRDIKPGNIMVETLRADEPREAPDHEVDAAQCAAFPPAAHFSRRSRRKPENPTSRKPESRSPVACNLRARRLVSPKSAPRGGLRWLRRWPWRISVSTSGGATPWATGVRATSGSRATAHPETSGSAKRTRQLWTRAMQPFGARVG